MHVHVHVNGIASNPIALGLSPETIAKIAVFAFACRYECHFPPKKLK